MRPLLAAAILLLAWGCGADEQPAVPRPPATARSLLLITIDTLRADRVGAYGDTGGADAGDGRARGARRRASTRAFATAPITLTSHASLMTGRYPPGHGARHNGMRVDLTMPTLADALLAQRVRHRRVRRRLPARSPLRPDQGFQTYGDACRAAPTDAPSTSGRPPGRGRGARAGSTSIAATASFSGSICSSRTRPTATRAMAAPAQARYDDEVAEADAQIARLIDALGATRAIDADRRRVRSRRSVRRARRDRPQHLRLRHDAAGAADPRRPGRAAPAPSKPPVGLVDVAPTVMPLLGAGRFDSDGIDLSPRAGRTTVADRGLYAESFAPLLDFGWSPLRAVRTAAGSTSPRRRPELYHLTADPGRDANVVGADRARAAAMQAQVDRIRPRRT